jgi:hypothetical protein
MLPASRNNPWGDPVLFALQGVNLKEDAGADLPHTCCHLSLLNQADRKASSAAFITRHKTPPIIVLIPIT